MSDVGAKHPRQEPSEMEDSRDPDIDNSDIDDSVSDGDQVSARLNLQLPSVEVLIVRRLPL